MQKRLCDFCSKNSNFTGQRPRDSKESQTKYLLALSGEAGFLIKSDHTWAEFQNSISEYAETSEHVVEFDEISQLFVKTTKPNGFGLTPFLNSIEIASANPDKSYNQHRQAIEFRPATPLEYLDRWIACNETFGDDVRVASIIRWKCDAVSICITQPQYSGLPAEDRDIIRYFEAAGWVKLNDPSGHLIFFHYGYALMAIDAAGRNCFINEQGIQPFDVILCSPDEETEKFLKIYPL